MCTKDDSHPAYKTEQASDLNSEANLTSDLARRAEHRCQAALSSYAINTNSLEVTRPTTTNCPDGGHDLGVTGNVEEVKNLLSTLTGKTPSELVFLDQSAKNGKLKVRIDVKNGKTISGDIVDKHAADSNRSPDCQANLLISTNDNVKVTPEAKRRLEKQEYFFQKEGIFIGIALPDGLKKVEAMNKAISDESTKDKLP